MFGIDLTDFIIGGAAALVAIQFYPSLANVGAWLVRQARAGYAKIRR